MKVTTNQIWTRIFKQLRVGDKFSGTGVVGQNRFKSDLLSLDQLYKHGEALAKKHTLRKGRSRDLLLSKLSANQEVLLEVRKLLIDTIRSGKTTMPPAVEWYLDNFYLIEEQFFIAKRHLPRKYSEELLNLDSGSSAGMPRVYDLALELISHSDGRVDMRSLSGFINAYQKFGELNIGELWAIPIMLRLAIVENLRRIAESISIDLKSEVEAEAWAEKILITIEKSPSNLILTIADLARSKPQLNSPFVAAFNRKLQGKGPAMNLPLSWLEQQCDVSGVKIHDLIRLNNNKQAADQVGVRNCIETLRFLGAMDWQEFVESHSIIEQLLRKEKLSVYPAMDFASRDNYRHVVESLAKKSHLKESAVAEVVVNLANAYSGNDTKTKKKSHVGYYLLDKGLITTEKETGIRISPGRKLFRLAARANLFLYVFFIIAFSIALSALTIYFMPEWPVAEKPWQVLWMFLLLISCFSQLSVSVINWATTLWVRPRLLPRMDYSTHIPPENRTLVAIPTMLSDKAYVEEQIEMLEIRYLANKIDNLHFCLLTDFLDAAEQTLPVDEELLDLACSMIAKLNEKYYRPDYEVFFLFHRPRKWNPKENRWMGYERKRGKLEALNAFILGKGMDEFSIVTGDFRVLKNVKYVITLDADTRLPRETAWKYVATMAHPLNAAIFNNKKRRVTEGYGILQPRIISGMSDDYPTQYSRIQGNHKGLDPYSKVSSDVYQDLFGEGSYTGKGIYDVIAFEKSLSRVFPENRILSHDLIEGCYARSGALSDVIVYDGNPDCYPDDMKRHHRWIRGDWQIAGWLFPIIRLGNGKRIKNRLSALSRWKIFDNLRRSLFPLSMLLLMASACAITHFHWYWISLILIIYFLSPVLEFLHNTLSKPADINLRLHFREKSKDLKESVLRLLFDITVLPFEAFKYADAILRTLWRLIISQKRLLEWTPSSLDSRKGKGRMTSYYIEMWMAPALGLSCLLSIVVFQSGLHISSFPLIALWVMAPAIAWKVSLTKRGKTPQLSSNQQLFLYRLARKTWCFFEEFVTEEHNWLPPDNFQEQPSPVVANRSSPTNMGLALLADLAAHDFGFISQDNLLERCSNSLHTMNKMPRFKGHFYNWYNTNTLEILRPGYISSVDSGNLIGHLLTLKYGLLNFKNEPLISLNIFKGIRATIQILKDVAEVENKQAIELLISQVQKAGKADKISARAVLYNIEKWLDLISASIEPGVKMNSPAWEWILRLKKQLLETKDDLQKILPWLKTPFTMSEYGISDICEENPSLEETRVYVSLIMDVIKGKASQNKRLKPGNKFDAETELLNDSLKNIKIRIEAIENLADICEKLSTVEYDFLFNNSTRLLSIGFNTDEMKRDNSYYDLLASEARFAVFVGISQGKLPQDSWFALARLLTESGSTPVLISWSGSMFEYLMPQLVMPEYENTLLHQTNRASVKKQIEYGNTMGVPWGISESAYNEMDASLNYQYKAFGVPGLGLKRGLDTELVIAPYASMMALMIAPSRACENLIRMHSEGFCGYFGFYEAIDYTRDRLPADNHYSILKSFMTHHQGMGLLSIAYALLDRPMQKRFMSEPRFQASLPLLQERIPKATIFYAHTTDIIEYHTTSVESQVRTFTSPHTEIPQIQILSNGQYQLIISNAGSGCSRWKNLAVTRWREDITKDDYGTFFYIRDILADKTWSNTFQPTLVSSASYEAIFSHSRVEFKRKDYGLITKTEIVVSPEDDVEIRRIRITNQNLSTRIIDITSYTEVVLATQASDEAHPAFSNLFVETEIIPEGNALICTRRPRSSEEKPPWMFHMMEAYNTEIEDVSFESDRLKFIGRGRSRVNPLANENEKLSGSSGAVLDPVLSIRYRIKIRPRQTAIIDAITGIGESKSECLEILNRYQDRYLKKRAFELAWTYNQVLLRQIKASDADAQIYNRLASHILYANPGMRADAQVIQSNNRGQSGLWGHSVSGDLPVVLLQVHDSENFDLIRQVVQAHVFWRMIGIPVDLVIWNEDFTSYRQELQLRIQSLISAATGNILFNLFQPGNIYLKTSDQISTEDRILFESVARVIIRDDKGSLADQLGRVMTEKPILSIFEKSNEIARESEFSLKMPENLVYFNGIGGFTPEGSEYKIHSSGEVITHLPWVNVLSNSLLGTVISQSGSAYTWALNAHEYRLTPWNNDPVSDTGGEAFYLRDETTGAFWSPTPFPVSSELPYITTHGFGYTIFEHTEQGIHSELTVFVDKVQPVKFFKFRLINRSGRERIITVTGFMEIVLADIRSRSGMHIVSEFEPGFSAILFRNRYNVAFADRITFFRTDGLKPSFTADRVSFIGRNRNLSDPLAMLRAQLSGAFGAGLDPCGALQVRFEIADKQEEEVCFQLGSEENIHSAHKLLEILSSTNYPSVSLHEVKEYWRNITRAVLLETPELSLNLLANGWMVYQTLSCRILARSGYYQSGGAYGFRDQLQDVIALMHADPEIARNHILLCAARQFPEGDVQHWWHPPEGRGVRTKCSDDLLWLPYAVSRYVKTTDDRDILNKQVGFLECRQLFPEEESLYDLPIYGNLSATLYEHCVRAIACSLKFGNHNLPLIGSGDWNDGMDKVGNQGRGESVWLGFFLYDVLTEFSDVASIWGDKKFSVKCLREAAILRENIIDFAWDGEWFKRAWFDDGTPLGSQENKECSIDAIAQSWSVISGAAPHHMQTTAMNSLDKYLVNRELNLIRLLFPPFDYQGLNPGYIQGYVPGVRENGGQYSHAAIWSLIAFAELENREKVWELFKIVNPILHANQSKNSLIYKVEPYVMAADIYANESHKGRGGWTWYTGAAGWMYQFIIGSLIGLEKIGNTLHFKPCFPLEWESAWLSYQYGKSTYKIKIFQDMESSNSWWKSGNVEGTGDTLLLEDDGGIHEVEMHIAVKS